MQMDRNGRSKKKSLNEKKQQFLKEFPNFSISRNGEKRIPMLSMSQKDPENFFTCNQKWQVCSFDFTFRKVMSETSAYRIKKFNVIDDYFYGDNITTNRKIEYSKKHYASLDPNRIISFDELIIYRGHHICNS